MSRRVELARAWLKDTTPPVKPKKERVVRANGAEAVAAARAARQRIFDRHSRGRTPGL